MSSTCATTSGLSQTQFFISSRVSAHCVRFFSGKLAKRASRRLKFFQFAPHFTPRTLHKPVAHITCKHQLVAFIVVDDYRIQRLSGV